MTSDNDGSALHGEFDERFSAAPATHSASGGRR